MRTETRRSLKEEILKEFNLGMMYDAGYVIDIAFKKIQQRIDELIKENIEYNKQDTTLTVTSVAERRLLRRLKNQLLK